MKKILVVEDEYYARKSIVKILQESDLDIQVCGEAANGMKAIELLEEYKDIALVITDIQMQKMGGLELASYLHKHIPEIDVLILTAFENFDYAREALRYNVKDYIVKPIYKENLLPPVKKVLEKQEEKSRNQEKIKNYYQWEAAKNYFPVKTIVAHEELYKEFFSYNAIHQEEKFCIVVMQEEELVTDVELVNRIIQEKYRGFIKDFFFSKINEEYVMLLSGIECMDNELIVQEKVESMLSYFCTCKHMNITMGVGLVYSSKEKIYQSYNEALYALNQRLIQGWNRAYFYKNMDGYKARIGKEAEIKLESIVRTRKEKEINQVIHSILEDIIIKEESAQKLYMAVVEILKILGNYYAELYQDEDIEELKDIKVMFSRRYDLYKFKHIEELENYLKEMVIVICSGKENTKKKSKIVEEIVHYVENNYYKNISLRELAENKYFVNYSYCSRLFSQETGMNFSKYLIQYRLKKAKTLLENKDMKISFIAFEVGYNDVSHFIQSFKKKVGCFDFTNPHFIEWYKPKVRSVVSMGIGAVKTDFSEAVPEDAVYFDGSTGIQGHNKLTFLYAKTIYDIMAEVKIPLGELPMLWGRSGYAGSHTIPAAWAGDSSTHLNNHACILRGGLSASMSGIPFWGFDMGGFYNTDHEGYECVPTDEEYIRSCQFGFFNSLSRCHGKTPREPWNFGEKAEKIFKKFNDIRHLLLPYLYSTTYKTHLSDIPVIRPVVMEYPEDRSARNVELEYFLGDSLLVVPVFDQEDEIDVYLPNGQWIDLFTHERIKGGRWVKRKIELDKIPVFIRQNKMIPMLTKIPENIEEKYENLDVILFCEDEIRDTYIDDGNVQNLKAKIEEGTLFINTDMDASYFTVYAEKCLDNAVVNGQNWEIKKEKEGYYKIALEK